MHHYIQVIVCNLIEIKCIYEYSFYIYTEHSSYDMHDATLQGFSQDFRIGCQKIRIWGDLGVKKYTFGMIWVSNSFSSHCILHKKYGY